VHLLRPADRDRDPAGPVPRLGIVGHIDDREAAEVLLGLDERPVGEDGRAAARVDAAHGGRRVQTAVAEDEDTAAVISSITALPALPLSRSSSIVRSGTHSSLKAIRYSAIPAPLLTGSPGELPLTCSTKALVCDTTPPTGLFQASGRRAGTSLRGNQVLAWPVEVDLAGFGSAAAEPYDAPTGRAHPMSRRR
jgi:hypothetical protein